MNGAVSPASTGHGGSEVRVHVEVDEMVVRLVVRRDVLVAEAVVERQVAAGAPVVLDEEIPFTAAHLDVPGTVLHRRLLRVAEEEVGEVEPGAGHGAAARQG